MLRGTVSMFEVHCRLGWSRIGDRKRGWKSGRLHFDDIHVAGAGRDCIILVCVLRYRSRCTPQVEVMHRDPRTRRACFGAVISGGSYDIVLKRRAATRTLAIAMSQARALIGPTKHSSILTSHHQRTLKCFASSQQRFRVPVMNNQIRSTQASS